MEFSYVIDFKAPKINYFSAFRQLSGVKGQVANKIQYDGCLRVVSISTVDHTLNRNCALFRCCNGFGAIWDCWTFAGLSGAPNSARWPTQPQAVNSPLHLHGRPCALSSGCLHASSL
jgi:hypothetical protein